MRSSQPLARRPGRAVQPLKLLLAVCLSLSFPLTASHARDLVVFGEPTLMNALQRVGAAWRERSGPRVNVFVAPSDLSLAQIQRGARCDIVFALAGPATRWNDRIQAALFNPHRLMPTYSEEEAVKDFRYNAYYGEDKVPKLDGASYRLILS